MMNRLLVRYDIGKSGQVEFVKIMNKLNSAKEDANKVNILVAGDFEFQVQDKNIFYIMNLMNRSCDCRE